MAIKFLNSVNADSGVLYVDANSNRVGIGTTSPAVGLDVRPLARFWHGSSTNYTQFSNGNEINTFNSSGGSTVMYLQYRSGSLNVGAGTLIVQSGNGNVGIGTTSPGDKLEVSGNVYAHAFNSVGTLSRYNGTGGIAIAGLAGTPYAYISAYSNSGGAGKSLALQKDGGNVGIGTTAPSAKLEVYTSGSTLTNNIKFGDSSVGYLAAGNTGVYLSDKNGVGAIMFRHDTRYVGIGTTSPAAPLHVVGNILSQSGRVYTDALQGYSGNTITLGDGSTALNLISRSSQAIGITGGNVGIGTTSPAYNLDVQGPTNGMIRAYGPSIARLSLQNSTRHYSTSVQGSTWLFYDETGGAERIRITSSGNVGIGTTNPTQKLHVQGTSNFQGVVQVTGGTFVDADRRNIYLNSFAAGGGAGIFFRDGFAYNASITAEDHSGSSADGICISGYDGVSFSTGSNSKNERMRIASDGNVGIGTIQPLAKLDVQVPNNTVGVQVTNADGNTVAKLRSAGTPGRGELYLDNNGTTNVFFGALGNSYINAGNVGIGTTTPSHKLQVAGNIYANAGQIYIDNGYYLSGGDATSRIYLGNNGSQGVQIYTNSTERMRIADGGNVGIGTTSPANKLHVHGQGASIYSVFARSDAKWMYLHSGANDPAIGWDAGGDMRFGTATSNVGGGFTERVRITSAGNVGIGTASPSYKLDVDGQIVSRNSTAGRLSTISGTRNINLQSFSGDWNYLRSNGANFFIGTEDASNLYFATNNSQRMTIAPSGNVGIGTTNPTSQFHIHASFNATSGDLITTKIYSNGNVAANGNTRTGLDVETNRTGWYNSDSTSGNFKISNNNRIGVSNLIGVKSLATIDVNNIYSGVSAQGSLTAFYGKVTTTYTTGSGPVSNGYGLRIDAPEVAANSEIVNYYGAYIDGGSVLGTLTNKYALVTEANAGNVGIGTASPSEKLDVVGNIKLGDGGTGASLKYNSTNRGTILVNGSEIMRLEAAGNVGIGTTSPSAKLHVYNAGNSFIKIDSDATSPYMAGVEFVRSSINGGRIYNDGGAVQVKLESYFGYDSANPTRGGFMFKTAPVTSGTLVDAVRIDARGYVGIGTASPSEKLHVVGDVRIEGDLTVNGSYTQIDTDVNTTEQWNVTNDGTGPAVTINQTGAQDIMDVQDDGTSVFYIEDGGNIGLGTTNPLEKLHVEGAIKLGQHSAVVGNGIAHHTNGYLYVTGGTSGAAIGNDSYSSAVYAVDNGSLELYAGSSNRLHITSGGNVGIGTTQPLFPISVQESQASANNRIIANFSKNYSGNQFGSTIVRVGRTQLTSTNPGDDVQALDLEFNSGGGGPHRYGTYADGIISNGSSPTNGPYGSLHFATTGAIRMTIGGGTIAGNVGIGTTSPAAKLVVAGTAYINQTSDYFGATNTKVQISAGSSSDNVGIRSNKLYLYSYANGADSQLIFGDGQAHWSLFANDNRFSLYNYATSSTNIYVSNAGNVGIGTTSPSEKLEVNGNVKADNFIGGNEAGIYTFNDTVNASASEDIFSISNDHGAQAFRVTFVCSTTDYSVAKTYEVVHAFSKDPVFFKVVDTGAWNDGSADHDFDVTFATEAGTAEANKKKIICTITNNSTTINADIVTTVFLGGSPTTITVTAL